jgi:hypothetical protein
MEQVHARIALLEASVLQWDQQNACSAQQDCFQVLQDLQVARAVLRGTLPQFEVLPIVWSVKLVRWHQQDLQLVAIVQPAFHLSSLEQQLAPYVPLVLLQRKICPNCVLNALKVALQLLLGLLSVLSVLIQQLLGVVLQMSPTVQCVFLAILDSQIMGKPADRVWEWLDLFVIEKI